MPDLFLNNVEIAKIYSIAIAIAMNKISNEVITSKLIQKFNFYCGILLFPGFSVQNNLSFQGAY